MVLAEKEISQAQQDSWKMVKFGDIAQEVKVSTNDPLSIGLERYVGLDHLDPESLRLQRWGLIEEDNPSFTRVFRAGQVLFGKRRCYQKKAAVADFDGICSGDIIVIEPKGDALLPELLPFIIQSDRFFEWAEKTSSGSLSPRTKFKNLAEYRLPLPPFENQKHLVHLLGKVKGLIAKRKQHRQDLDDLLKIIFLEMFGDPLQNKMGWDKPELENFGKISTGNTPPRNDQSNYSGQHTEWIKTDNISADCVYVSEASEYLSETGVRKARLVTKGALLVASIAGSLDSIGRSALTDRTISFNQQINAIQPNKDVNSFYLYALFKISKGYIQGFASEGLKKILTKGVFEKITMIKPPIELQNQFATIVEIVEEIKAKNQKALLGLEKIYGILSQKAFKDKLDV